MAAIVARHHCHGRTVPDDPRLILDHLNADPGPDPVAADDVPAVLIIQAWKHWHERDSELTTLLRLEALGIPRRVIAPPLRLNPRTGVQARIDLLRRSLADPHNLHGPDTPQTKDHRQEWLDGRRTNWTALAKGLIEHRDLADDDEESDTYADLLDVAEAASAGIWTPARIITLGLAAKSLAADARGKVPATHPVFARCEDVRRALVSMPR